MLFPFNGTRGSSASTSTIRCRSTCAHQAMDHLFRRGMSSGTSPSPRRTQGSPPHPGLGPQPRTSAGKHASKPFRSRKRLPVVDVLRQTIGNGPQRRRVVGQPHVTALHRNAFRQACRGFTARLPWNDTVVPGVDRRGRNGNRRSVFGFDAVDRSSIA